MTDARDDSAVSRAWRLSFGRLPRLIYRDLLRSGCVSLFGPQRAGKSALAAGLMASWQEEGGLVRHLDLRALVDEVEQLRPRSFLADICRERLLAALGHRDPAALPADHFQAALGEGIKTQPPRTLLTLDHCEALPDDIAYDLLVALRAALQEQASQLGRAGISLLLISAGSIAGITRGLTSPFLNMTVVYRLEDLSPNEAKEWLAAALGAHGLSIEEATLTWLVDALGGDRDLLRRGVNRLVTNGLQAVDEISLPAVQSLCYDLLDEALAQPPDWPLANELLAGLTASRLLFDVLSDLLARDITNLREVRRDFGVAEASGFVIETRSVYRFRTPFHETLSRRLLSERTLGDLAVLHGDWARARTQYRAATAIGDHDNSLVSPADLGLGLATSLAEADTVESVLVLVTEMLADCYCLRNPLIFTVRGRNARQFVPLIPATSLTADLYSQVEKCALHRRPQVVRVPTGQRWTLPLSIRGADGLPYAHWVLVLTNAEGPDAGAFREAQRLCLFAEQRLGERMEADQDRAFAKITASIHAALGLDGTLQQVARAALDLTGASFSSIEYPDATGLMTRAVHSRDGPSPVQYRQPNPTTLLQGVTRHVYGTGKAVLIGHKDQQTEVFDGFEMIPGIDGAVAEAAVPIRFQGHELGVINVESEIPWVFAWRHIAILERLAELAGIAISDAGKLDRAKHDATLGRVFGGIAHEANNHGTAIGLRANLTLRHIESGQCDATQVGAALKVILRHTRGILELADDFRWLNRPGPNRTGPRVSLQQTITDALDALPERLVSLAAAPSAAGIAGLVTADVPPTPVLWVHGRPRLLQRAVENLLQNACEAVYGRAAREHRDPLPGDVSIVLERHAKALPAKAVIQVHDRGAGLADPAEVFEPYYTTKGVKGLGLGLAIVKQVIEVHHGTVKAEARGDGPGACFRIELELCDESGPDDNLAEVDDE